MWVNFHKVSPLLFHDLTCVYFFIYYLFLSGGSYASKGDGFLSDLRFTLRDLVKYILLNSLFWQKKDLHLRQKCPTFNDFLWMRLQLNSISTGRRHEEGSHSDSLTHTWRPLSLCGKCHDMDRLWHVTRGVDRFWCGQVLMVPLGVCMLDAWSPWRGGGGGVELFRVGLVQGDRGAWGHDQGRKDCPFSGGVIEKEQSHPLPPHLVAYCVIFLRSLLQAWEVTWPEVRMKAAPVLMLGLRMSKLWTQETALHSPQAHCLITATENQLIQ